MTINDLRQQLIEMRDRDGNYVEKRHEEADLLLTFITDQINDSSQKRNLQELHDDIWE